MGVQDVYKRSSYALLALNHRFTYIHILACIYYVSIAYVYIYILNFVLNEMKPSSICSGTCKASREFSIVKWFFFSLHTIAFAEVFGGEFSKVCSKSPQHPVNALFFKLFNYRRLFFFFFFAND